MYNTTDSKTNTPGREGGKQRGGRVGSKGEGGWEAKGREGGKQHLYSNQIRKTVLLVCRLRDLPGSHNYVSHLSSFSQ